MAGVLTRDRSDVTARRTALRTLDQPLSAELIDGGAMTLGELTAGVRDRDLLGTQVDPSTVEEWWASAKARELLRCVDESSGSYVATDRARDELASHQQRDLTAPGIGRAVGYLVPSGTVGTAIVLAGRDTQLAVALVAIAVVGLLLVVAARAADLLMQQRWLGAGVDEGVIRAHARWLDGQPTQWLWQKLPGETNFVRLHGVPQQAALPAGGSAQPPAAAA